MCKENSLKTFFISLLIVAGLASLIKETVFQNRGEVLAANNYSTTTGLQDFLLEHYLNNTGSKIEKSEKGSFSLRVPVLMYHYIRRGILPRDRIPYILTVTPEDFDKQLGFLSSEGYQTISLNDLYDSLENKTPLPKKSVILTFDDGYKDFYTNVFPLLKKYNFRAVNFFITGYTSNSLYMNWDELREIHESGLVDIESHTLSHFDLTKIPLEVAMREIFDSKKILEENLKKKVNYFAYPYGSYNNLIVDLVKKAGYKLAFSTNPGVDLHSSEQFFLKRVTVSGFDTLETFKAKLYN
jgi:peptidoglycan/xylan/chitin deacetylase (PgdA/CDA1 family)